MSGNHIQNFESRFYVHLMASFKKQTNKQQTKPFPHNVRYFHSWEMYFKSQRSFMLISLLTKIPGHLEILLEPVYGKILKHYHKLFLQKKNKKEQHTQWAQNSQCSLHMLGIMLSTIQFPSILKKLRP